MSHTPCDHSADAAGWVLGALWPETAERFAAHLQSCATCRAEVAELAGASERLAAAPPPLAPPPELRERLMASVHAEAGLFNAARADPHPLEPRSRWRFDRSRWGVGALATVATIATLVTAIALLTAKHPSPQASARTVIGKVTPGGGARARAVVQIGTHTATLIVTRLAAPPPGRVYQAWVIRRGSPAAPTGALFSVPLSGDTRILLPTLHDVTEVIVTAEPPRGSATPTPPPIVLVGLSQRPGRVAIRS